MKLLFVLLFQILLFFLGKSQKSTCDNNRKIFTNKTGVITDGLLPYKNGQRCEWLVKGKFRFIYFVKIMIM